MSMESTEKESGKWLIRLMMILLGLAVLFGVAIVIIYIYGVDGFLPNLKIKAEWGVVGDFFGGILNPVFAFLGLIMLLATLYQSQKELALTREELASSRAALEDQALTQKQQRFENTFFALLEQHNKLINEVKDGGYLFDWRGVDNPKQARDKLWADMSRKVQGITNRTSQNRFGDAVVFNSNSVRTYCRVLYQLLLAIRKTQSDYCDCTEQEKFYANIVRSFVYDELGKLILLNSLCFDEGGYGEFRRLIERYEFLEHVPISNDDNPIARKIFSEVVNEDLYDPSAFGDRWFYNQLKMPASA